MTSTPVSDATLFFSNISTKNQNVTDLGSAKTSFSEVMNKTTNLSTGTDSNQGKVAETYENAEAVSNKDSNVEDENNIQETTTGEVEKTEKDALDDDPHRDPGHGTAVVFHHLLDHLRRLVALRHLGAGGGSLGDPGQPVLLQSCEIYLPGMPRGVQTRSEGSLLGESHAHRP